MSYSEFPHTNYSDQDFHELIELYTKVHNEYHGTLEQINNVNKRLDEYQNSMNAVIRQQVDNAVESAITSYSSTIETTLSELKASLNTLNNQLDSYQQELSRSVEMLSNSINLETRDREYADNVLSGRIDAVVVHMDSISANVAAQLASEHATLERKLEELNATIDSKLSDVLTQSAMYTAQQINALDSKLSSQINEISKASGHKAIKWLWQNGCYHGGFNAERWYYLSMITCEEWNKTEITCTEWYVDAKNIFRRFDSRNKMYSPVSGRWVDVKVAVMELAVALNINGMTAEEYDSLGLTADEYDRFFMTAQVYDWAGKGEKLCTVEEQTC